MKIIAKNIKNVIGWALGVLSVYMIYKGIVISISTSGVLWGSEYGMLITLVNQIGIVMV